MVHRRGCVLTVYVCTYIRGTGRNYHLSFIAPVPSGGLLTASGILISSEKNYAFKQGSVFSVFFVTGSDGVKPGVLDVPLVPSSKIKEYELLRPMRIHVLRAAEATPCTDEVTKYFVLRSLYSVRNGAKTLEPTHSTTIAVSRLKSIAVVRLNGQ
ncbi:uncharacterized protein CIMG_03666 [Coccidioides immitis RS]|uniref:Uncharacterized protein n=1 Tax=Coccidioides immitis (strain RS) TaxID=246410 RepID=A0A0E1RYC9_COCIM|nr:uncharacterized protein CIMG_03666 [Coccidioides immitis RS]EAS32642.2 hypothetical protein CIMG_03666 [Coccidioides immitis RS]